MYKAKKFRIVAEDSEIYSEKLNTPYSVIEYAKKVVNKDTISIYESFYLIAINQNNNVLGYTTISNGSINNCSIDIRIICKYAIETLCTEVIIIHNHPSDNPKPSQNDIDITKRIKEGLAIFDIQLVDHVIVTEHNHYSFACEGML